MKPIAIYGAGGLGREILILIKQMNAQNSQWEPVGFFDDNVPKGTLVHGLPVLGGMDVLNNYNTELAVALAIGSPATKKYLVEKVSNSHITFPNLVHPSVQMFDYQKIKISRGCIITAGNILTADIDIDDFVLLNLACTVGHDVKIGRYCSVMPGVNISGGITCEEGVYLGTGAKLINPITVWKFATIGAGAVVISNVPADTTFMGVPAIEKGAKTRE